MQSNQSDGESYLITLEDIAKKAGVSHSTVSRALADSQLVNPATKEKIRKLAEDSGYQVNQVARNLKTRSTQTVGLIVPEVSNPFYPELIQRIAEQLRMAGYNLQLQLSGSDQSAERTCVQSLKSSRADGILLITGDSGLVASEEVLSAIESGTPVIVMGWVEGFEQLDIVAGDDAAGGKAIARHLVELGHERIAVIRKAPHRGSLDRLVGFDEGLKEFGVAIEPEMIIEISDQLDIRDAIRRLLRTEPLPTAIFAYQDSIAAMVYQILQERGLRIPEDLTVIGFDNLDLATLLSPPLTTVGMHLDPLASEFVNLLLSRILNSDQTRFPSHIIVTPQLVVRGSSSRPRSSAFTPSFQS